MSLADAVNDWYAADPLWGNMLVIACLTAVWALLDLLEHVVMKKKGGS